MNYSKVSVMLAVVTLLVTGCSGGTGGTGGNPLPPIGNGDLSVGAVTKLGSVFVNGVEFDTTGATITRDGITVAESQVLGMPVEVRGDINGDMGTADTVVAKTAVKGTVNSIISTTSLVVMGQTVRLEDGAYIETLANGSSGTLADLSVGSLVEVAGMPKPGGVIVATRLEEKTSLVEYKVKGYIEGTISATTFTIGALTIDYSSADMTDLPGGPVLNLLVEVKASAAPAPVMMATKVEPEGPSISDAQEAEVEGYVKGLTGSSPDYVFFINGQEVHTDSATIFEGATATYFAENVKVEAEGTLVADVLNAYKVKLKDSVRMEGDIENLSGNSFNLVGMPGVTITVNAATEINSSTDVFSDFANGSHVRLRGFPSSGTSVLVTRIDERNTGDPDAYLRGPVDSVAGTVVTVLGIAIDVNGFSFKDHDDVSMNQAAFLAALSTGVPVKIQGLISGSSITWDSAELED